MSVQGLINQALGAGAQAAGKEKPEDKTADQLAAEKLATQHQKTAAATENANYAAARAELARLKADTAKVKAEAKKDQQIDPTKPRAKKATSKKAVKGLPSAEDVQSATQAAAEQVKTRSDTNTAVKKTLQEQRENAASVDSAAIIRQLREAGYISGRQAKRVIYNINKGGVN